MSEAPEPKSIDHLLGQICRLHHHRALTPFEEVGIHRGQPPLLFTLWDRERRTRSELSAILHIQPTAVAQMVQRMERTSFVIAHRLSTVRETDKILVNDGEIIQQGTHRQLLEQHGFCHNQYLSQFKGNQVPETVAVTA